MSQLHLAFELIPLLTSLKMCPRAQRTVLEVNLKENRRLDFLLKCSAKRVFLLHQMLSLFSTIYFAYVLEIISLEKIIQI